MMTKEVRTFIRPIEPKDFVAVQILANLQFGEDYLSREEMEKYIEDEDFFGLVATRRGQVIGFSLCQYFDFEDLDKHIFEELDWFKSHFKNAKRIGNLKMIGVHGEYQTVGVGQKLVEGSLREMRLTVPAVLSVCWVKNETAPLAQLVERHGMDLLKSIPKYWHKDSLAKGYNCAICGAPPCQCDAAVYASFGE